MIKLTEDEYKNKENYSIGYCLSCRVEHDSVEPDAENYKCEQCNENKVMGMQNMLIIGLIEIIEE